MAKKKLSDKEKEEMKQAFEEQQKRREEELQFRKKLFPDGVLKPGDDRELHVLDIDFKQLQIDLLNKMATGFAERLQATQEAKIKGTNQTKENAERNYNKFVKIVERESIDIVRLKKSALESTFHKHGLILKESTLYNYKRRYIQDKKLLA